MVCDSGLHSRRDAGRLMYANEVKERHVDGDSGLKIVKALAESQAQPSETAKMRSHAQICALDVRGADSFNLRVCAGGGCGPTVGSGRRPVQVSGDWQGSTAKIGCATKSQDVIESCGDFRPRQFFLLYL